MKIWISNLSAFISSKWNHAFGLMSSLGDISSIPMYYSLQVADYHINIDADRANYGSLIWYALIKSIYYGQYSYFFWIEAGTMTPSTNRFATVFFTHNFKLSGYIKNSLDMLICCTNLGCYRRKLFDNQLYFIIKFILICVFTSLVLHTKAVPFYGAL